MKLNKKLITIIIALLVISGVATYITQQEEPAVPTVAPVEVPVEQPVETPTETPVEGDAAVEGQPAADETTATGNLGGSVGENNFGMTNLMDSIKDNDQTDVEHSLDLEEQKQEQSQPLSGNGSSVGSDVGSGNSAGTQTGVPSGNDGSGTGSSVGGNSGTGTQPEVPSQPQAPSGNGFDAQTNEDFKNNGKTQLENDASVKEVGKYNEEVGGWEVTGNTGDKEIALPDGTFMDEAFLEILKQYGK